MSEENKSYRIRANVGSEDYIYVDANLLQDYDAFDVLSVSVNTSDMYRLHNSNYGIVVGRVLANNGFGVPNAKVSVFIAADTTDDIEMNTIYPFSFSSDKDDKGVRYNLLPDEKVADCHQIVGTFPNKRYLLDNDILLEVFDKYYKFTTRTNNAGDYLICGVPVGNHVIHMDLDLSDCGILSQRPRDFVYKGYTIEQFENPNMFKEGTDYNNLSQVFSQDQAINVVPFWGNTELGDELGITRADININFTFEPTCVFLGSVASDNSSQGIAKGCVPTPHMGDMDELTTGEGKIEMIRKTPGGSVEEFQIRGTQLINGDGIWCYQIPMNLDYMMTDEYGNMVPTDSPDKGIPTRARVRFRLSMQDNEQNTDNYFRPKVLIPHNPQNNINDSGHEDYDYEFGSATREDSFRDLFWNNVYSVKSYIPRFQKRGSSRGWKEDRYTGIKGCNFYGSNNPIPYNNIRIKMPFMFTLMCLIIKTLVLAISIVNSIVSFVGHFIARTACVIDKIPGHSVIIKHPSHLFKLAMRMKLIVLEDGICPDLENWYFAPMYVRNLKKVHYGKTDDLFYNILKQTLDSVMDRETPADSGDDEIDDVGFSTTTPDDVRAVDTDNTDYEDETTCITVKTDYLMHCIEMNLAQEYKVIKFNFYNDWINGLIYVPRFMRYIRPKKKFLGITVARSKVRGCMDDTKIFAKNRRYTQQCAIGYKKDNQLKCFTSIKSEKYEYKDKKTKKKIEIPYNNKYHKRFGFKQVKIFGKNGGICHEHPTLKKQYVYYLKPCEWPEKSGWLAENKKVNLFATDIILLGSLNNCDNNGLPQAFRYLSSTSYIMPTNLALTNMETNGALYATDNGTMCMGGDVTTDPSIPINRDYTLSEIQSLFPAVKDLMSGATSALTQEIKYLQSSSSPNDAVETEDNELVDIIPMTIAAGISWNYTGPGQGKIHPEALYYPGGHFLGMSCKNSQTNIKSCLNLERICEIGATMSQRKEDVVNFDRNTNSLEYAYSSPTGFISGEEIINTDFRTMFATMNSGRLIANKTNPNTGYKVYDFSYYRPSNFDGTFSEISENYREDYNYKRNVMDETGSLKQLLPNIADVSDRDDYDINEVINAQNRTRESTSLDYYLFRYGLTYDNYVKSGVQERKFLGFDKGTGYYYLPQYENSFYFYFGMKYGATAIDEFNKQFFSECESVSLIGDNLGVDLTGTVAPCTAKATLSVRTRGLRMPYQMVSVNGDTGYTTTYANQTSFNIDNLELGEYVVVIKDAADAEVGNKITLGDDFVTADVTTFDFNVDPADAPAEQYRGGYIEVSDVEIEGLNVMLDICTLVVKSGNTVTTSGDTEINSEQVSRLFVDSEGDYTLYLRYRCGSGAQTQEIKIKDFSILGAASMDIIVGDKATTSIKSKLGYSVGNFWFDNICTDATSVDEWIYRIGFFNEINKANEGTETTDCLVSTINGERVIWGYPQNSHRVLKTAGVLCSAKDEIPAGYTLDDENSYYSTYGVSGGSVVNYSAVVVNGEIVGGKFYGRLIGGAVSASTNDLKHYKKGYGYVFKPLPYGDLEYYVYNGTDLEYNSGYTEGLFFPSVIYPVMERPFFTNADFFTWTAKQVVSDGLSVSEELTIDGVHSELEIHNGITFNNKFDINGECVINGEPVAIGVTRTDVYGLSSGSSVDRITDYRNDVTLTDVSSASYRITEGHPNGVPYSTMVNSISDTINGTWPDNFIYTMDASSHISGVTAFPYESGIIDGADYYLCAQGGPLNIRFIDKNGYVMKIVPDKNTGNDNYYVLCRYTRASDNEGSSVIALFKKDENAGVWYCTYDGNTVTITPQGMSEIDDILDNLTTYISVLVAEKKKTILAHPTINSVEKPWKDVVEACIVEKIEWHNGVGGPSTNVFNEDDFFIVGITSQNAASNPDGETKLYNVFPYVFKVSRIIR